MHTSLPSFARIGAIAIAAASAIAIATPGIAAETGYIRLSAQVPQNCTLSIMDRDDVPARSRGMAATPIAAIEERCNAPTGYKVTLSSRNGGVLVDSDGGSIPYTLLYEGIGASIHGGLTLSRNRPGAARHELAVTTGRTGKATPVGFDDIVTVTIEAR